MTINRLQGLNPVNSVEESQKYLPRTSSIDSSDTINISAESKEMAEAYYVAEIASQTPDVREDRIAEVRAKIEDPNYINNAVIDIVADRIMDTFGI